MKNNSKTSLFLMELIIVILFFSIASVVCVQLFVNAYKTNQTTKELSKATLITQSLAEGYMGCGGSVTDMISLFDSATVTDNTLYLFYDSEWNSTPSENSAAYVAKLTADILPGDLEGGILSNAVITVYKNADNNNETIITQDITHYEQYRLEDVK